MGQELNARSDVCSPSTVQEKPLNDPLYPHGATDKNISGERPLGEKKLLIQMGNVVSRKVSQVNLRPEGKGEWNQPGCQMRVCRDGGGVL